MTIDRRRLLIGGGAGIGLLVAWGVWPRAYAPNLVANPGETIVNAFLKIGADGRVTVAVPQSEFGQGSYTSIAQIVADELGADWRTVGIEAAPINPLYANALLGIELGLIPASEKLGAAGSWAAAEYAERETLMLSGAGTTIRAFEARCREAGAGARALLCQAAASMWDADWQACDTLDGFVVRGNDRVRFGDVAAQAIGYDLPDPIPLREGKENRLTGQPLPRIDLPAKVDGSANFAGDVRLPGIVYCAIRQGPAGDTRLKAVDKAAANRITGVLAVVEHERWVAAVGTNWWAANRALDAMHPSFETRGALADDGTIAAALDGAFGAPGARIAEAGDLSSAFAGKQLFTANYSVALGVHAAIEPPAAAADFSDGRLQLWIATQAPAHVRRAAAAAIGISEDAVIVHPMLGGGAIGRAFEVEVAAQAAWLAKQLKRPVQLGWSRVEDLLQDRYRPAAKARMAARIGVGGRIEGWLAKIATPPAARELRARMTGETAHAALAANRGKADALAIDGAIPAYGIPAWAVDHHPADIGVATGHVRGAGHVLSAFFTECFIDELSHVAGIEAFGFRMQMLNSNPRLARCLSIAASLGGWEGGVPGSGQGIACHMMRGSCIAVLAEAHIDATQRVVVDRLVAAVDCGRHIHPDIVRQQIEGALIFGMAGATGAATGFEHGMATARRFGDLRLPRLRDTPEIVVELIASTEPPGGVSDIAVPPVAPAIANAIRAGAGQRLRSLPLTIGGYA